MTISRECQAIIDYAKAAGVLYRVTDINTPGVHTATSWHYAQGTGGIGTAVDLAGTSSGTTPAMVAQMTAIWKAFLPAGARLAELFFQAPGITTVIKNGKVMSALTVLSRSTWDAHRNHVHVAVRPGVFLVAPLPEPKGVAPVFNPPLQIVDFLANPDGPGGWGLGPDGGIYGLGGCPWRGIDRQPLGKSYWEGRKAARLEANGSGYTVVATSGERYDFP